MKNIKKNIKTHIDIINKQIDYIEKNIFIFADIMMDQILPFVYMVGILLLVLPAFLQSNSKLKQFLTNLTIWIIIVLIVLTFIYIFKD